MIAVPFSMRLRGRPPPPWRWTTVIIIIIIVVVVGIVIVIAIIIIIIIEGLSLLQSIPPTTADKQTQAQKRRGSRSRKLLGAKAKSYRLKN